MIARSGVIRTERLLLRPVGEDDLDVLHEVHADPATNRYNPAGPVRHLAKSRVMLTTWRAHWADHGFGYWAVCRADDGGVLGFGGLQHKDLAGEPVLNLYYRFATYAWGAGYAAEMARAALDLAGRLDTKAPVVALIRESNLPSRRVAERVGLVPVGTIEYEGVPTLVHRSPDRPAL